MTPSLRTQLGLAGMLRTGEWQRLFQIETAFPVPTRIELRRRADIGEESLVGDVALEDELCLYHARGRYQRREPHPNLLFEFVRLADADDSRVLDFATRWGLLKLCAHGRPGGHPVPGNFCLPVPWEPVRIWRAHARRLGAALAIAAALHDKKLGPEEVWTILDPDRTEHSAGPMKRGGKWEKLQFMWGKRLEWDRTLLAKHINEWLQEGEVRPRFLWWEDAPSMALSVGGLSQLWGYLVRELTFMVARKDGAALCAGCGQFFVPDRKPAATRRAWCPPCRKAGASRRQAQRDLRARSQHQPSKRRT